MKPEPDAVADAWLVLRCQEGSPEAFQELLKRWRPRLWLHAVRIVGNEDAAQDVVQESLLAITRGIRKLDDPHRFRGWAYSIVTFKGRDWIRTQVRRRRLEEEAAAEPQAEPPSPIATGGPAHQPIADVTDALAQLPEAQRHLLRLRYHLGLTLREISHLESVPEGTVKSRLHQARADLKRKLQSQKERT